MKISWKNIENWRSWKMSFFWGGHFEFFFCFISMKTSSPFIWGIIYFCTMDGSFRILEKTSSELICTRLYTHYGTSLTQLAFELWIKNLWFCVIFRIFLIFHLIKTEEYLAKNLLYWDSSDFLIVWTNCFALRSVLLYFKRKRHHENTFFDF